jgi:excinuclease ABC subunit A
MAAAERAARSESERSRRQAERYLVIQNVLGVRHGTRLRPEALSSRLDDRTIADIAARELGGVRAFAAQLPPKLPVELERLTTGLLSELTGALQPLLDLGLGLPQPGPGGATLSTGERQRLELNSTVRANTAGMLYVLDEPSVGLPLKPRGSALDDR